MKKAFILTGALFALLVILLLPKNEVNAAVSDGTPDNGWYTIQTKTNATFRIGADKNNLILQKSANTTDQKFKLIKISNGVYRIGTGRSAGMLFLKSGIKQIAYDGSKAMQWKLEYDTSGKFYYIKNINSGKYLTYASLKNGVQATKGTKKNDDTQKFILTPYTPNYTVTFKDDTKVIKRQAVKSGKAATAPANPAKTGYNFNGWDKAYTNVKNNLVIKPKWGAKTVKVVFHINIPNDTRTYTETYTYDKISSFGMNLTDKPGQFGKWDRTGYSLSGWAFENNATNAQYPIYCGVENQWINKNSPGTVDLYAIWKPKKYTVTFKNGTTTLKTQQVEYTKSATAPAMPTKTGYIFDGWDKTFNNITGNLTVNAKWKAKTVKVVFHYNGDIKENVYGIANETFTETYTYGKTNQSFGMTLHDILNTTELPGEFGKWDRRPVCSLLGWSFDKNATTAKYSNYNEVKDGWIDSNAGTVDLYAVWNKKTGWFTVNGVEKYYINGDRARGLQKIGNTYYIFGKTDKKAGIEYAKGNELHIGAFWGQRRYPIEPEKNNGRTFSFFYLTFDGKNLYTIDGANDFERTLTNKGLKRGEDTEILYSKDYIAVNEKNEIINSLARNIYNYYGKNYAACINSEGVVYKNGLFYAMSNSEYASAVGSNVDFAYYTTKDFKEYTLHKGPLTKIKPDNLDKYNLYKGTKENQTEENTKNCLTLEQQENTEYRWAPEIFCDTKDEKIYVFFSGQTNVSKYPEKLKKNERLDIKYRFNIYMSKEIKNNNGEIEWETKKCEFLDSNGGTTGAGAWNVGIEPDYGAFNSFIDAQVFQDGKTYYMAVKRDDGGLGDRCAYLLLYKTDNLDTGKWRFEKVLDNGNDIKENANLFKKTEIQYTYDADKLGTAFTGKFPAKATHGFEGPTISKINEKYFLYTDHYIYNPTYLVNCKISKFMQFPVQYDATMHYASGSNLSDLKYDRYTTWDSAKKTWTGEKNINNYTLNAYATNVEAYTDNKQEELTSRGHPLRHGSINKIPDDNEAFSMLQKIYNIPKTETDAAKTYTVRFYAGNTLLSEQQVGFNKSATQPIEEAKKHTPSGKKFTGWDTQYQNIIGDIKISAVYVNLYNITYKGIDNTTVYKPETGYVPKVTQYTKVDTSKVEMPLYTPVKTGYTFAGWELNGINIGTKLPLKTEGNITLTATWK